MSANHDKRPVPAEERIARGENAAARTQPPHDGPRDSASRARASRLAATVEAAARDWRDTLDSMRAAVLVVDADGIVLRASRTAAEWLNVGVTSLPGRRFAELAEGPPWARAASLAESVRAGRRGDGTELYDEERGVAWELRVDPVHDGCHDGGSVIVSMREVTEMVVARERARRNASLAALGSLVAGVAHELRNPMLAISAHVEALALEEGSLPGQAESIDAIRSELKRIGHLLMELLEYGRPLSRDFENVSVAEILASAIAASGSAAYTGSVHVRVRCAAMPPLKGDAARLRRVFLNLIENAIQHSEPEGVVQIDGQTLERGGQMLIEVRVSDQGPGFSAHDIEHAFEPFYTRRRGGTGLGLPLVRRVVSDHGGTVEVGNAPTGGAYALVRIPLQPAP